MAAPRSRTAQPAFEELYQQLEQKVALLEKGGLSLDDSLAAYEDAVALAQKCQQMLEGAELRITRLRETMVAEKQASYETFEYDESDESDAEDEPLNADGDGSGIEEEVST